MRQYWIWYHMVQGIPSGKKRRLLSRFPDIRALYENRNTKISGFEEEMQLLSQGVSLEQSVAMMRRWEQAGIYTLTPADDTYPEKLKELSDPPLSLFYMGTLPDFSACPGISIIGTRKADAYGLRIARKLAGEIAACGGLVISGGAAGIDTQALEGALEVGEPVVAVLGTGVDVAYPAENRKLFSVIAKKGCLISEYLPGTLGKPWQFPERNRIVSALSDGVLVVQAPQKSGAMITARMAMEQNKDVYVVPGNIDAATHSGSNVLLEQGAAPAFSGWGVMQNYESRYPGAVAQRQPQWQRVLEQEEQTVLEQKKDEKNGLYNINKKKAVDNPINKPYSVMETRVEELSNAEQQVLKVLTQQPVHQDFLADTLEISPVQLMSVVTKLAMANLVSIYPGKMIALKKGK